jgi:hypothetical protein
MFGNTPGTVGTLAFNMAGNTPAAAEGTCNVITNKDKTNGKNNNINNNNNNMEEGKESGGPESYFPVFVSVSVSHKFHRTQIIATSVATERGRHCALCKPKNQSAVQFRLTVNLCLLLQNTVIRITVVSLMILVLYSSVFNAE